MYPKSQSHKFLDVCVSTLTVIVPIAWGLLAYYIVISPKLFL